MRVAQCVRGGVVEEEERQKDPRINFAGATTSRFGAVLKVAQVELATTTTHRAFMAQPRVRVLLLVLVTRIPIFWSIGRGIYCKCPKVSFSRFTVAKREVLLILRVVTSWCRFGIVVVDQQQECSASCIQVHWSGWTQEDITASAGNRGKSSACVCFPTVK